MKTNTTQPFVREDLRQVVTDTIIEQLENGVVPWQQSWKSRQPLLQGLPYNTLTGNKYRGVNILLLWAATIKKDFQTNEWGTMKHWNSFKEYIRKGEKPTMIIKYETKEKEVDGEKINYSYIIKHLVFNRSQLQSWEGIDTERNKPLSLNQSIERSVIIDDFIGKTGAKIDHDGNGPCYNRVWDKISMPRADKFFDTDTCTAMEGYYSATLHELTHWSGAPHRLNRVKGKRYGDSEYAYEELVAELGAAFLCAEFDIATLQKGDHAAYIDYWIKLLNENKQILISAAADASKAYDYLFDLQS